MNVTTARNSGSLVDPQGDREPLEHRPGFSHSAYSVRESPTPTELNICHWGRKGGTQSGPSPGQEPCLLPALLINNSNN